MSRQLTRTSKQSAKDGDWGEIKSFVEVKPNSATDLTQIIAAYQGERDIRVPKGNYAYAEADLPINITEDGFVLDGTPETNIYHSGTANPAAETPIFNIHNHGSRVYDFHFKNFKSRPSYLAGIDYPNRTLFRIEGMFGGLIENVRSHDNGHFIHMFTDATHQNRRLLVNKVIHYYNCGYVFYGEATGYAAGSPADVGALHFRSVWQHNDLFAQRHTGSATPHAASGGYHLAGGDGGLAVSFSSVECVNQYGIHVEHGTAGSGSANGQLFSNCTIEKPALGSDVGGERHQLTNCMFATSSVDGLILRSSAKGNRLVGCNFRDNSFDNIGVYSGVKLVDVLNASFVGCGSYNQAGANKYQHYGFEETGTSDYNGYVGCATINIADVAINVFAANSKKDANNNQFRA